MEDQLPFSLPFLVFLLTVMNLLLVVLNYSLVRGTQLRNLAAKYKDRLYELNKLALQYPEVAAAFEAGTHSGAAVQAACGEAIHGRAAARPQDEAAAVRLEAQLYAYVRFRINFYEEIYYATRDGRLKALEDSARWRGYIDSRLGHPLVQQAIRAERGIYGDAFVSYALGS